MILPSRSQLIHDSSLTQTDLAKIAQCRGDPQRLGFAYQLALCGSSSVSRGRINARELHEQMNSCSCLTLILACIIYWQAKQITQTVRSEAVAEEGIDATLLQHVSPIEWDNVILYGQYVLDRALVR